MRRAPVFLVFIFHVYLYVVMSLVVLVSLLVDRIKYSTG